MILLNELCCSTDYRSLVLAGALGDFWTINISGSTWKNLQLQGVPSARYSHVFIQSGGQLYCFGGVDTTGEFCVRVCAFLS